MDWKGGGLEGGQISVRRKNSVKPLQFSTKNIMRKLNEGRSQVMTPGKRFSLLQQKWGPTKRKSRRGAHCRRGFASARGVSIRVVPEGVVKDGKKVLMRLGSGPGTTKIARKKCRRQEGLTEKNRYALKSRDSNQSRERLGARKRGVPRKKETPLDFELLRQLRALEKGREPQTKKFQLKKCCGRIRAGEARGKAQKEPQGGGVGGGEKKHAQRHLFSLCGGKGETGGKLPAHEKKGAAEKGFR